MLGASEATRCHPGGGTEGKHASVCDQSLLIFTKQWKCFQPEVSLPADEFSSLLSYEKALINSAATPFPSPGASTLLPEHSGVCCRESLASEGESSIWDDEPVYESLADFFRSPTRAKEQGDAGVDRKG